MAETLLSMLHAVEYAERAPQLNPLPTVDKQVQVEIVKSEEELSAALLAFNTRLCDVCALCVPGM
jgi:hypothetical protein